MMFVWTGGFTDLADAEIEDLMLATSDAWLAGENLPQMVISQLCQVPQDDLDFDKREALGVSPVLPLIEEYQSLPLLYLVPFGSLKSFSLV